MASESGNRKSKRRLRIAICVAVFLVGLSLGLHYLANLVPGIPGEEGSVFKLDFDEYMVNKDAYIHDAKGNVELDTVIIPKVPAIVATSIAPTNGGFLGPQSCAECHRDNFDSFIKTSHFRSSGIASAQTILGSFEPGKNVMQSKSQNLAIEMIRKDQRLVQRLLLSSQGKTVGQEFSIDLFTGSGKIAQSYLYWEGPHLYQLHASYMTATNSWMNSPGYADGIADFARPILPSCLECHATYIQPVHFTSNQYQREHTILGITCEKCHGPGEQHVTFHRAHPDVKTAEKIVNPGKMTSQRSLEICQLCHGGDHEMVDEQRPPFSFRPGEPLGDYYRPHGEVDSSTAVHSNTQLPRLKMSKCFLQSESMTCMHCHDPHRFERGDTPLFSQRCMNCHEPRSCGQFEVLGENQIRQNCIDCHMPRQQLTDVVFNSQNVEHMPLMRDHFIRVWQDESHRFKRLIQGNTEK